MRKLILSAFSIDRKVEGVKIISLLKKGEKISIPIMRKRLKDIDLNNTLIFSLEPKISKIFKPDYKFNDHGIYYTVESNPANDKELENCVLVPMESATKERDYERFNNYESFVDPVFEYGIVRTTEEYKQYFNDSIFILDIETTGLDFTTDNLTMLSVKNIQTKELLILSNPSVSEVKQVLKLLEGNTVIGHNLVFDLSWLMYYCNLEYAPEFETVDTMLLAHVMGERSLSLKHLSMMHGDFLGRRNTMTADDEYLIEDILTTELLYTKFNEGLKTFSGKLVCNAVKTFSETKVRGTHIDEKVLFELRDKYSEYEDLNSKYAFNVNSNRELAQYFLDNGVKLYKKTARGDYVVDQNYLAYLAPKYTVVQEYLDYKKELNIYQKYVKPYCLMQDFILRPDVKLWGTETGRLSCSNPNVQQIPNKSLFKDIFRSRFEGGFIATIDLDRAELGIAALLSNDEEYVKALTASDFHTLVASKTFGKPESEISKQERFTAKAVNFGGILYGGSAKGIAARVNAETESVEAIQQWYSSAFPVLTNWINAKKIESILYSGVLTYFGRYRSLEGLRKDQKERIGVNTSVQSVASDVMLYITVRLSSLIRERKLKSTVLFPVHDELLLDIHPEELEEIVLLLKKTFKDILKTPLGALELSNVLPISGELEYADSWLYLKSEGLKPQGSYYISSLENEDE